MGTLAVPVLSSWYSECCCSRTNRATGALPPRGLRQPRTLRATGWSPSATHERAPAGRVRPAAQQCLDPDTRILQAPARIPEVYPLHRSSGHNGLRNARRMDRMSPSSPSPVVPSALERLAPFLAFGCVAVMLLILGLGTWQWMATNLTARETHEELALKRKALVSMERTRVVEQSANAKAASDRKAAEMKASAAARELESKLKQEQERDERATDKTARAEAQSVINATAGMLAAAEVAAAEGDPAAVAIFDAALSEASRMLNHQQSNRGGSLQPELDVVVADMLVRKGRLAAARAHYERAASTGRGLLADNQLADCWLAAGESALATNDLAAVDHLASEAGATGAELTPTQRLKLAMLRALGSKEGTPKTLRRKDLRNWLAAAELVAADNPKELHDAAIALGSDMRAQAELEEAERTVRAQLERDQRRAAPPMEMLESQVLLAWILTDRGRAAEGAPLREQAVATFRSIEPTMYARVPSIVLDFLVRQQDWDAAAALLTARWMAAADPATAPAERLRLAKSLAELYESAGKPELAAQWRSTLDQLKASRPPAGDKHDEN